jgi:transposase
MKNRANIQPPTTENYIARIAELEVQNAAMAAKLKWYEEQFRLAQIKRFGSSSEKTHPDQLELNLFNEAEILATSVSSEPDIEKVTYSRKKSIGGREAKLDQFPVETIIYGLPEGERVCECCGGELHETEQRLNLSLRLPRNVDVGW